MPHHYDLARQHFLSIDSVIGNIFEKKGGLQITYRLHYKKHQ